MHVWRTTPQAHEPGRVARLLRRWRGPSSPEDATLEELIAAFCDPWKAERMERRWRRNGTMPNV